MHVVTRSAAIVATLFAPLAAAAQTAPSADEIIARHVTAIGGQDAVLRVKSIKNSGTLEMPSAGISATMESFSAPNRSFVRMTIPGIGDIKNGYDGTVAWEINPMKGPRIKTDKEKILAQEDADFYGSLLFSKERYQSTETIGAADFGGEQTWQVKTVLKSGKTTNEFFSVATGLRVGLSSAQESQSGIINVITIESDYKKFGPIKLATRNEMITGAQKVVVTLTEVVLDAIMTDAFVLPEPVKALLIKQ
ncbi:MAG: hypothetical protein ABI120_03505 [Gemmatimonadaceae bacterium]